MVEGKVVVKAVEVAGLPVEEEGKEVVVVVAGHQEVAEDGQVEVVEDGQVEVVAAVAAGKRVEQLKIGGKRYLFDFINAHLY